MSILERIRANVKIDDNGCWIWQLSKTRAGYGQIQTGKTMAGVHRIMYRETHGEIPEGLSVLHTCDVKPCCNPDHLFVGTQKENLEDAVAKGRMKHGVGHYLAKLDDGKVAAIVERLKSGDTHAALAQEFGVTAGAIGCIKRGQSWVHVTGGPVALSVTRVRDSRGRYIMRG